MDMDMDMDRNTDTDTDTDTFLSRARVGEKKENVELLLELFVNLFDFLFFSLC